MDEDQVRIIQRLLATTDHVPPDIQADLIRLGIVPEPFPSKFLCKLEAIVNRYENPEPMRDAEFVAMARKDIASLIAENRTLREFVTTVFFWRAGLSSDEQFAAAETKLQSWLANN